MITIIMLELRLTILIIRLLTTIMNTSSNATNSNT